MNLWIRSQDNGLYEFKIILPPYEDGSLWGKIGGEFILLGKYKSKERALEVLDEIRNKIKNTCLMVPKTMLKLSDLESAKKTCEKLNDVNIITCNSSFDLIPINNAIVYEMPKE